MGVVPARKAKAPAQGTNPEAEANAVARRGTSQAVATGETYTWETPTLAVSERSPPLSSKSIAG
jgi:hypothetical protein